METRKSSPNQNLNKALGQCKKPDKVFVELRKVHSDNAFHEYREHIRHSPHRGKVKFSCAVILVVRRVMQHPDGVSQHLSLSLAFRNRKSRFSFSKFRLSPPTSEGH